MVRSMFGVNHIKILRLTLSPRAFIKVASSSDTIATENMKRECQVYRLPRVASAECIRRMYDEVDDSTIALEWMDTTLAEMKYQPGIRSQFLIMAVLRAALTSCVILEDHKYVNTGIVPSHGDLITVVNCPKTTNPLISCFLASTPTV